mmetsp:Transcript_22430/g.42336  ORF Transcript_22430/g.42336 Transcript_22430/m.42336 type:complete len:374 (+) Transcript_22430:136-1257(+)
MGGLDFSRACALFFHLVHGSKLQELNSTNETLNHPNQTVTDDTKLGCRLGFSERFQSPEQYILDITYEIWEERGLQKIWDYYSEDCPVKTPMSVSVGVQPVIDSTYATLKQFPDRLLLGEDIIIGDWSEVRFYSSHRVRSPATHQGDGLFGPATGKAITMLTIADCICEGDKIIDEYLVRDNSGVALQLGIDPVDQVRRMIEQGNRDGETPAAQLVERWSDTYTSCGDPQIGKVAVQAYTKRFGQLAGFKEYAECYDRSIRFEASGNTLAYGTERMEAWVRSRLAGLSNPEFQIHHMITKQVDGKPPKVAMRWSLTADHATDSMFGPGSGKRVALLGVSHFELRDGKISNEWCLFDELSVYAQLAQNATTATA